MTREHQAASVGASSELFVAADLLRQNREVYRALAPNSSCDLAVLHDKQVVRIEVRTGHRAESRDLPTCQWTDYDRNKGVDVLAVVVQHPTAIFYLDPRTGLTPSKMKEFVWGSSFV